MSKTDRILFGNNAQLFPNPSFPGQGQDVGAGWREGLARGQQVESVKSLAAGKLHADVHTPKHQAQTALLKKHRVTSLWRKPRALWIFRISFARHNKKSASRTHADVWVSCFKHVSATSLKMETLDISSPADKDGGRNHGLMCEITKYTDEWKQKPLESCCGESLAAGEQVICSETESRGSSLNGNVQK